MDELNKNIEELCGPDKQCQGRWLDVQTDCVKLKK